jgi:hypothetical protein
MGNQQNHKPNNETSTISQSVVSASRPTSKKKKKLDLKSLEKSLLSIDSLIDATRQVVCQAHEQLYAQIAYALDVDTKVYEKKIVRKKNELKQKLNSPHRGVQQVKFEENTKHLTQILIDSFHAINKFDSIQKKIAYLKFYNEFTIIDTSRPLSEQQCYNHIVLPLSRNKFFYCMAVFGKKSFMKITDARGNELARRAIKPALYYVQFCVYGNRVCGLYEETDRRDTSVLEIYTDELKLVASKLFNVKFDRLVFMSRSEVVCKTAESRNYYPYVFFNLSRLEPTFSFRVLNKIQDNESGGSEKDVIMLGSNTNELYLYHVKKKFLKVLSRLDGKSMCAIDLDKALVNSSSLDSVSNVCLHYESGCLIFKCNATRRLKCFEHVTGRLSESTSVSNLNVHFKSFDIDCYNDIYSCDNLNKKIYFL